eukprot:365219-Chlamydomonas_euryale.AAC.43
MPGGPVCMPGGPVCMPGGPLCMPGVPVCMPSGPVCMPGGPVCMPGGAVHVSQPQLLTAIVHHRSVNTLQYLQLQNNQLVGCACATVWFACSLRKLMCTKEGQQAGHTFHMKALC